METANTLMDVVILVLLIAAIGMGGALMLQIYKFRKERFRFDQMTQALSGQLAIFQATLESGKLDMESKIARLNAAIEHAQMLTDEMHAMAENGVRQQAPRQAARETERPAAMRPKTPPPVITEEPEEREERPFFSIIDPEYMIGVKEENRPAVDDFGDLSATDRSELAQLATPAEKNLMAALKRAGKR